eukprot:COSAG01_NODE_591_length_15119_cov_19.340879_9_plen_122_part_00
MVDAYDGGTCSECTNVCHCTRHCHPGTALCNLCENAPVKPGFCEAILGPFPPGWVTLNSHDFAGYPPLAAAKADMPHMTGMCDSDPLRHSVLYAYSTVPLIRRVSALRCNQCVGRLAEGME